jgi:EpsI family protein
MRSAPLVRAGIFAVAMAVAMVVGIVWRPTHFLADSKAHVDLETMFPASFGTWAIDPSIVPLQPAPDLEKVIAETYDQTLARTYRDANGDRIMLSIAYGRNQNEGMNTHRPEICYPAQGFPIVPGSSQVTTLPFEGRPVKVTKLVAATSTRHEPITYWLIVGDQITTFGRGHKIATLEYGLRGVIPDGMLIRVSSIDPEDEHAFRLQQRFIDDMLAAMTPANRVVVLGSAAPPA